MDFRKVENIFIVAFLLLNIYLLFSYFNRYNLQYASTTSNQMEITEVMEQSGIELPEFENNTPTVYSMQADQNNLLEEQAGELEEQAGSVAADGSYYTSFLSNPVELEGNTEEGFTQNDEVTLDAFVNSDRVLFGEEYEFGSFDSENNRFLYFQDVNGLPVTDGTSEISLYLDEEGDIFSYQQTFAGPMTEQGEPLSLITDQEAVEILFQNNEIPSNATVRSPELVYQRTLNLEDLSMYSPVWMIVCETAGGTEIHRVNARDGQVLSPPSDNSASENNSENRDEEEAEDSNQEEINEENSAA